MGVLIILFVLVIFIPVGVLMSGGAGAAILGFFLKKTVDDAYEGNELLELS